MKEPWKVTMHCHSHALLLCYVAIVVMVILVEVGARSACVYVFICICVYVHMYAYAHARARDQVYMCVPPCGCLARPAAAPCLAWPVLLLPLMVPAEPTLRMVGTVVVAGHSRCPCGALVEEQRIS